MGDVRLVFDVEERQQVGEDNDDCVWEAYKVFVDDMRAIGDWLPTESSSIEEYRFDVILQNSCHKIRLRLCRLTFNIIGYLVEGSSSSSNGQWLEFGYNIKPTRWRQRLMDMPSHLIPGSVFMDMRNDYDDLVDKLDTQENLYTIPLGQSDLVTAVDMLATTENQGQRARSLIVVSLIVCQGSRFLAIRDHLAKEFKRSSPLPSDLISSVSKYQEYYLKLLPQVSHPGCISCPSKVGYGIYRRKREKRRCKDGQDSSPGPKGNLDTLLNKAAIGKNKSDSVLNGVIGGSHNMVDLDRGKSKEAPPLSWSSFVCPGYPRPLAQVFFLRIDELMGEKPGYFYGTITVNSGFGDDIIYHRAKEEAESVMPGQTVVLTGPSASILAQSHFEFNFALMGEEKFPYGGQLCWDKGSRSFQNEYNKVVVEDFDGEYCTVSLCYVAYNDAVEAKLDVRVTRSSVGDVGQLWGEIAARCGKFEHESVLFCRKSSECVEARLDEPINLSRSVVAVSCNSTLLVRVGLYNSDGVIVNDTVEFSAQPSGFKEKDIHNDGGEVRVRITWK